MAIINKDLTENDLGIPHFNSSWNGKRFYGDKLYKNEKLVCYDYTDDTGVDILVKFFNKYGITTTNDLFEYIDQQYNDYKQFNVNNTYEPNVDTMEWYKENYAKELKENPYKVKNLTGIFNCCISCNMIAYLVWCIIYDID